MLRDDPVPDLAKTPMACAREARGAFAVFAISVGGSSLAAYRAGRRGRSSSRARIDRRWRNL
ncbi:hypothetical protein B5F40_02595 [Gordonibacter sp. An230]|nr:hypothetical protein B5F40_02595 [Gordonibacter sp. An230]